MKQYTLLAFILFANVCQAQIYQPSGNDTIRMGVYPYSIINIRPKNKIILDNTHIIDCWERVDTIIGKDTIRLRRNVCTNGTLMGLYPRTIKIKSKKVTKEKIIVDTNNIRIESIAGKNVILSGTFPNYTFTVDSTTILKDEKVKLLKFPNPPYTFNSPLPHLTLFSGNSATMEIQQGVNYKDSWGEKSSNLPDLDTIKVVMLTSDTAHKYLEYLNFNSDTDKIVKEDFAPNEGATHWQKGYSVRKKDNYNRTSNGDWNCYNCEDYMSHSYYLDANKKILSPTIIVWQSVQKK